MQAAPIVRPVSTVRSQHNDVLRLLKDGPVFLARRGNLAAAIVSIDEWNQIAAAMQRLEDMEDLVSTLEVELERATGNRSTIRMSKTEVQEW